MSKEQLTNEHQCPMEKKYNITNIIPKKCNTSQKNNKCNINQNYNKYNTKNITLFKISLIL